MSTPAPFPVNAQYTAIAIAYRNNRMIADEVLPRVPVARDFKYLKHNLADGFTVPDTKVSRTGQVNKVAFSATEETASVDDWGLDAPVPQSDIDVAPAGHDPLGKATEQTTNLILLDREVRTSQLVFNAGSYATGNKTTLSGTSQWSHAESKPIPAIVNALDSCIMRPNIAVLGRATSTKLRMNPSVVKAYNGTLGEDGMVPLAFLQELFELEAIFVGEARLNIARPGQAISVQRVWGGHASFIYRDRLADARSGTTFGLTGEFGTRIAGATPDKNIGLRGGQMVRVGESVKELITAPDLGFFFENAIAGV